MEFVDLVALRMHRATELSSVIGHHVLASLMPTEMSDGLTHLEWKKEEEEGSK